ncbi:MAG: hypothetical protein JNK21_05860, partial [Rhodospirillaceae bacterium]|nr:hypothetical protein [Rhodospirillaceae bacterium]
MTDTLLVLNAGSSSLKFQVFQASNVSVLMQGAVTRIGAAAQLKAVLADGNSSTHHLAAGADHDAALAAVMDLIGHHNKSWR